MITQLKAFRAFLISSIADVSSPAILMPRGARRSGRRRGATARAGFLCRIHREDSPADIQTLRTALGGLSAKDTEVTGMNATPGRNSWNSIGSSAMAVRLKQTNGEKNELHLQRGDRWTHTFFRAHQLAQSGNGHLTRAS